MTALGLATALVAWAPLWTGLYAAALGRPVAVGGLQFGGAEARFLGLLASGLAALAVALLALVAVSAGALVAFNLMGPMGLPLVGQVPGGVVAAALVWLFGLGGLAWAGARLAFAPAMTLVEARLVIEPAWPAARGRAGAVLVAVLLAHGPTLLALSLVGLFDSFAGLAPFAGGWPRPLAIMGGAAFGILVAFVQAPLTAGALVALHRPGAGAALAAGTQSGATLQPA
jgi:hypothetical protein